MYTHMYIHVWVHRTHVECLEVKRQLVRVCFLLLPCEFWGIEYRLAGQQVSRHGGKNYLYPPSPQHVLLGWLDTGSHGPRLAWNPYCSEGCPWIPAFTSQGLYHHAWVYVVLGTKPRVLCMLARHFNQSGLHPQLGTQMPLYDNLTHRHQGLKTDTLNSDWSIHSCP